MYYPRILRPLQRQGPFLFSEVHVPSSNPRYADYQPRVNVRRWLRSQGRPCWICRAFGRVGTIDYTLPAGHPFSFEVDELVPVSLGGSPTARSNVDAAHRCCNQWRSNKTVEQVLALARRSDHNAPPQVESIQGVTSELSG